MADARLAPYLDAERDRILATLVDWVRIPSISSDPAHAADVRRSADFCAQLLRDAGLEHVEVLDGHGAPAVVGDWRHAGPDAPTLVVYGHHDVQPVDPVALWEAPPFEPTVVDGELRGRGTVDDKGQVLFQIEAVRGLLATEGRLPVNVVFLVEGEEEVGSPSIASLLTAESERLRCDAVVVSDTTMVAPDVPSTCVGMRGLVAFDVALRTAADDLHSGLFGGAVPNPAHHLARLVADLHDDGGQVTLPGFYDRVRPLTDAEEASLASVPFDEQAFMRTAGVRRLEGEAGRSTLERIGTRPTAEVTGIGVGYTGEGMKTIVPAGGHAKVTFRLVADQDPAEVAASFRRWVEARVPEGVDVVLTPHGAVAPALTPVEHPAVGALGRAIEKVWGRPPLFTREGGSGPEEALGRLLGAPVLFLGVGLPDDRFHAPNERLVLDQLWRGLLAAGELWHELAAVEWQSCNVPDDLHEWVSFDDPDEDRTWVFDVTFLLSRWTCIFGRGCQGVLTEPSPEKVQGCCSYGAHYTDDDDRARVEAAAAELTDEQWQFARTGRRKGISVAERNGTWRTRIHEGACVMLNRPGFPGGAGCALHRAALDHGEEPLERKPDVCWQLPLHRVDTTDGPGHVTSTVREWKRRDWGDGGSEFAWWCTEAPEAFSVPGEPTVLTGMKAELVALVGPAVHRRLLDAVAERLAAGGTPLPHPAVRRR